MLLIYIDTNKPVRFPLRAYWEMMDSMPTLVAAPRTRLVSVDVLRGLTIALMILVNDPGDWGHVYGQLDHSAWNGFTLTDFVFPNFLFLVGVSIVLSLHARTRRAGGTLDGAPRRAIRWRIVRRAALLVAIKLFLSAYPTFQLAHLRLFGVLTRIALCYLLAALLCLWTQRIWVLSLVAAGLLLGYWVLMRFVPVPGFGVPTRAMPLLDPERNLAAWMDRGLNTWTQRWLHTGSLYNGTHDPEGILSTIPAVGTTLIGCLAGLVLVRSDSSRGPGAVAALAIAGFVSVTGGLLWNETFPINKNLWTSSYVLFAGGCSLILLALCHWLFDRKRVQETRLGKTLTLPWLIYGSNAITVFVLSELVVETLLAVQLSNPRDSVHPMTAWAWPYWHWFAAHGSTDNTSLAFAAVFTGVCLIPNWILWRRQLFLRL